MYAMVDHAGTGTARQVDETKLVRFIMMLCTHENVESRVVCSQGIEVFEFLWLFVVVVFYV